MLVSCKSDTCVDMYRGKGVFGPKMFFLIPRYLYLILIFQVYLSEYTAGAIP
jgi:hypothetical protein